jgi:hypothetical protein
MSELDFKGKEFVYNHHNVNNPMMLGADDGVENPVARVFSKN